MHGMRKVLLGCLAVVVTCLVLQFGSTIPTVQRTLTSWGTTKTTKHLTPHWDKSDGTTQCTPRDHVLYLKTHKCAGTSIQNFIYRYGLQNKLDFVMPMGDHYISSTSNPRIALLIPPSNGTYDIICNNAIFNRELISLLPNDSIKITMVRNPVTHFESLFYFFDVYKYYKWTIEKKSLKRFLNNLDEHYYKIPIDSRVGWVHNQMLTDLGMSRRDLENRTVVEDYVSYLDQTFHLVMVYEHFMESIILLKDVMCWTFEDVVHVAINERNRAPIPPDSTMEQQILSFNWADKLLYDHFRKTFEQKLDEYGRGRMKRDVAHLKHLSDQLAHECGLRKVNVSDAEKFKTWMNKAKSYDLPREKANNTTCLLLSIPEGQLTKHVRGVQLNRTRASGVNFRD